MEKELINHGVGNYSLEAKLGEEEQPRFDNRSTFRKITDLYFKPKSFEKKGKIYEKLGVKYVQKAIMGTVGRLFKAISDGDPAFLYLIGRKKDSESLMKYERGTRIAELIHAPQIIWNVSSLSKSISEEDYGGAITSGLCLLINASCSMLQRYNRARIYDVVEKRENRNPHN